MYLAAGFLLDAEETDCSAGLDFFSSCFGAEEHATRTAHRLAIRAGFDMQPNYSAACQSQSLNPEGLDANLPDNWPKQCLQPCVSRSRPSFVRIRLPKVCSRSSC